MQPPNRFHRRRKIGQHDILLPTCPPVEQISGYNLPQKDQKFYRTELPHDFNSWDSEPRRKFIANEWDKRLNGFWFYNNGNIEYITGLNYFYVNWWRIDSGYPVFTDSDRDFFYVWRLVEETPSCDGLVYISYRGGGKTWKATAVMYEPISRKKNALGGMQSKTEPDAKRVFQKLVYSWSKLPDFFKPIDIGLSKPAKVLDFSAPSTRDTKNQNKDMSDVLNSSIDYAPSGVAAYDGATLHRAFMDEIGKTTEISVDERTNTIRECMRAGRNANGRGKTLSSTTVEEMEKKGGRACKLVWDKADRTRVDDNGYTQNGMYRLFIPADYGYLEIMNGQSFVDEYGYSLRDKARQFFLNKRKALKGADLNSEKRKFPLEEEDIWVSDSRKATYDTYRIEQQLKYNETLPRNILVRGKFIWKDGIKDSEVQWMPSEQGLWLMSWLPPNNQWNKKTMKRGKVAPANTHIGCFGLDPYDNRLTYDDRRSDAACYGFRKFDINDQYGSKCFVLEYLGRPPEPKTMYEEVLMACVFMGWQIHIENNKPGTVIYFRDRGYENYLMERPQTTMPNRIDINKEIEKGTPMSGSNAREALIGVTESYIFENIGLIEEAGKEARYGNCPFDRLLLSWLEFDVEQEWTIFDSMVGAGMALLGVPNYEPVNIKPKTIEMPFTMYRGGEKVDTSRDAAQREQQSQWRIETCRIKNQGF